MPSPVLWQSLACRQTAATAAAGPGAFGLAASRTAGLSTYEDTAAPSTHPACPDATDDDDDNDLIIPETQMPNDEPCTPYARAPCHTTNQVQVPTGGALCDAAANNI
jgi:hypothetical protein